MKKIILTILLTIAFNGFINAQSDSMFYREMDIKRMGLNYFNLSKPDRFNFEVVVIGGVKNPGIFLIPDGTSLVEVVGLTGGSVDESIYDNFKLIRAKNKNPELRADTVLIVSYKDFFDKDVTKLSPKHNPLLRPGDIISFPIKPDKDFWDIAGRIATIFIVPLFTLANFVIAILNYSK